jgi:hypothetical protein
MKHTISKTDILEFILQKDPFFFEYKIGDEVIYTHSCRLGTTKGIIEERGFTFKYGYSIIPEYKIKHGKESYDYNHSTEETLQHMTKKIKSIKQFDKILDKIKLKKEELQKLYTEFHNFGAN